MRKIETTLITAIRENLSFRSGSTHYDPRTRSVHLYASQIARATEGGEWMFSLAGWNTATTRSRINALLAHLRPGYCVGTQRGAPYVRSPDGTKRLLTNTTEWF